MFTLKLETSKYNRNSGNSIYNILGAIHFLFLGDSLNGESPYCFQKKICTKNLKVVEKKKKLGSVLNKKF